MLDLEKQNPALLVLWGLLAGAAFVSSMLELWSLAFIATSTLILSLVPLMLANRARITLPFPFLVANTIFIFASIFLGEAFDFYERIWWWDLLLHGSSAIGFGLLGFLFVFMLFEGDRFAAPAGAIAMIAFCFAITVGVTWEIFEFTADCLFDLQMQKSGLQDTMEDLMVNAVGASIAAFSGYLYLRGQTDGILSNFIEKFIKRNRRLYQKYKSRLKK